MMAMMHTFFKLLFLLLSLINASSASSINFTDSSIVPVPEAHYVRYVTFFATGTRTYVCDTQNATSAYTLAAFDYDLYDAEMDPAYSIVRGKHVLLLERDADGGNSVFYTATNGFTYW